SGNFTVTANGNLTQSGALDVSGTNSLTTFAVNTGNITLTQSGNNLANLAVTSANQVSLTNNAAINLAASTITGNFSLTTAGDITQSGALVNSATTTLNAGSSGDITLGNINNDFNTIIIPSAHNVSLQDTNDLSLGALSVHSLSVVAGGN